LHDDCDDSCWSLFFSAFSQQLAIHELVGEDFCVIIDVSKNNAHVPSVGTKMRLDALNNLFLAFFVVHVLFWLCANYGKP
jgi:hypothetical protein